MQITSPNMKPFCIMSDTQITSPDMFFILYNGRYTDHKSNMDPFCIMSDTQITSPKHLTLYRMMMDLWSVYLTIYRMTPRWDSWSVYLTLYRKDPCWTCDLCICHYTKWKTCRDSWSVYLTLYRMASCWDSWSVYLTNIQNDGMSGLVICVSGHYTGKDPCWTCDLCICHYTKWKHVGTRDLCNLIFLQNGRHVGTHDLCIWHCNRMMPCLDLWSVYLKFLQNDAMLGLMICASDIVQNDAHVGTRDLCIWYFYRMTPCWDSWSVYLT